MDEQQPTPEYDSPWKEILERFFPEFMAFFFPEAYAAIDWSQGYTFLDKELQKVVRDADIGQRRVDKLVRVTPLNSEEEAWVLAHIEVQGNTETDFAERMYIYNYRLFDRYGKRVASLAILSDSSPTWRPNQFEYTLFGCRISLDFPAIKLLDYESKWAELEAATNPFALVVMAHLQTIRTRHQANERYTAKLRLAKLLYQRNYSRQDILELFRFVDWVMALPTELEDKFMSDIATYETKERKPYVTSVERIATRRGLERGIELGKEFGLEQGLQQGLEQGKQLMRVMLLETLQVRFGELPQDLVIKLERISDETALKTLQRKAVLAESLEIFTQQLDDLLENGRFSEASTESQTL